MFGLQRVKLPSQTAVVTSAGFLNVMAVKVIFLHSGSGHSAVWYTPVLSCCSAHVYIHTNHFFPEDGSSIFLRNFHIHLQGYTVRHFRPGLLRTNIKALFPESYSKRRTEEQMSLLPHFPGCLLEVGAKENVP